MRLSGPTESRSSSQGGYMRILGRVARIAVVTMVMSSLSAVGAYAGSEVEPGSPGGPNYGDARPSNGVYLEESAGARERRQVAHLYSSAVGNPNSKSAWLLYNAARERFEARYGDTSDAGVAAPMANSTGSLFAVSASAVNTQSSYKTLNVSWVQQAKNYYCGPATAYMILKYRGFTKSAINQASLSQTALAGANYLKTESQGYTTTWTYYDSGYTLNDMSRGLNQWAYGMLQSAFWPYRIYSADTLKEGFRYSIDNNKPFAASTYEKPNGARYNNHPSSRTGEIGHWVVIYGYEASGGTAKVADPAAGMANYTNSAQKFYINTDTLYSFAASRYAVW